VLINIWRMKRLKNMNRKKRRRTFCGDCCNLSWN